jgi:ribosomal protein S1
MSEEVMDTPEAEPQAAPTSLADLKPKMKVSGKVARIELYGAFVDLGVGVNAILHISQLGRERVNRVADVLNVGDELSAWVDKVDPERGQVTLTLIEPLAVEWSDLKEGAVMSGTITRLEKFGAFIDIGAEKEGLVHVSEMSHGYVRHPSEAVHVGETVSVKVLSFDRRKRRIDLSMKALLESPQAAAASAARTESAPAEEVEEEEMEMPTAMEVALRNAMGDDEVNRYDRRRQFAKKSHKRQQQRRRDQDDILSRTLRMRD